MSKFDQIRQAARERRMAFRITMSKSSYVPPDLEYQKLNIKLGDRVTHGQNVDLYRPKALERMYGRKNLCLKVFRNGTKYWGKNEIMGVSHIQESTMVQNLMAIRGLAPRVYDIVEVNGKLAQVTDFLTGEPTTKNISDDRFKFCKRETTQPHNQIGGKLVDFQGARFRNFSEYKKHILRLANKKTQYPKGSLGLYQSTPYHSGKRNTKERLKQYGDIKFKGQNVLDVGCNLGMMCRAAYDAGAKRVVGIDWPDLVAISRELAVIDGYWNIDFHGADLRYYDWEGIQKLTGVERYNVMMFLAMEQSLGTPAWLDNCDILIYEGHGRERPFQIKEKGKIIKKATICNTN